VGGRSDLDSDTTTRARAAGRGSAMTRLGHTESPGRCGRAAAGPPILWNSPDTVGPPPVPPRARRRAWRAEGPGLAIEAKGSCLPGKGAGGGHPVARKGVRDSRRVTLSGTYDDAMSLASRALGPRTAFSPTDDTRGTAGASPVGGRRLGWFKFHWYSTALLWVARVWVHAGYPGCVWER
jgi:hypothetical protein